MSIIIKKVLSSEGVKHYCVIRHENEDIQAYVDAPSKEIHSLVNQVSLVELDFTELVKLEKLPSFQDQDSFIKQENNADGLIILCGTVHSVVPINNNESVIDVYIQNGPEFFSLSSSEIDGELKVSDAIKVTVNGLCFYPTRT